MNLQWAVLLILGLLSAPRSSHGQWQVQQSGSKARLRGLSVLNNRVAWATGASGTVLKTVDGGATWIRVTVADGLDFRDVHLADANVALVLSIGPGAASRIYQSGDGGATWALRFQNHDPAGFLDAIAFWDRRSGIALGDPVAGRFTILTSDDGGGSWQPTPASDSPAAATGEGAFAASGTCLITGEDGLTWFGTGGAKVSRVFRSGDRGRTWTVHETPIMAGTPSAGIFSMAFRDASHGVAVGGDYRKVEDVTRTVAITDDGGRRWRLPSRRAVGGFRSAVVAVPGSAPPAFVAVGPTGADLSVDDGESWTPLGRGAFHVAAFADAAAGWAAGEDGLVARFVGRMR